MLSVTEARIKWQKETEEYVTTYATDVQSFAKEWKMTNRAAAAVATEYANLHMELLVTQCDEWGQLSNVMDVRQKAITMLYSDLENSYGRLEAYLNRLRTLYSILQQKTQTLDNLLDNGLNMKADQHLSVFKSCTLSKIVDVAYTILACYRKELTCKSIICDSFELLKHVPLEEPKNHQKKIIPTREELEIQISAWQLEPYVDVEPMEILLKLLNL